MLTETKSRIVGPDITIIEISGRLTLGNLLLSIENSVRRVIDGGSRKLIFDLTMLQSIDSSGIGMIVGCSAHMEHRGGKIRIAGPRDAVGKVFAMVHLERIVPVDADVDLSCRHLLADSAAV